jgi:hypothetical protein
VADASASGQLTVAWDGVTPATAPAGSVVGPFNVGRDTTIGIDVRGTFTATVTIEVTTDGLNWFAPQIFTTGGVGSTATFTAPGTKDALVSGRSLIRARCSAFTSGTATVVMAGSPGGGGGSSGGGGGGGAVTIADGADIAQGTTADAGIITDTSGTVIGFLRGAILRWNTFLGRLPAALTGSGNLKVSVAESTATVTTTGAGGTFPATQSGTWTVQPGNTANTTAWKVDGSAVTQPVSGTVTITPSGTQTISGTVTVGAGTANAANVGGITTIITSTLTRPANTTAYTAGDEITDTGGTIRTITSAATKSGGSGVIAGIGLSQSSGTPCTGLEIWIFDTTSTPQTDNAAFAPADGEVDTCIAICPLTVSYQGTTGTGGNVFYDTGQISLPFLTVGSANLYWRLVTRAAYTAGANSDTMKARFRILQDL